MIPTAAARQRPDLAVANARRWFGALGLAVEELPVLKRGDAQDERLAARAAGGRFFYIVGGDPGHLVDVLRASAVWTAIEQAWREGAALGGSSAGAMALCEHVLVRERWPNSVRRRTAPGLGLVPGVAAVPHFDGGGGRWTSADDVQVLGIDERTAALWDGERWRASGPGRVVFDGRTYRDGDDISGLPSPL